MKSLQDWNDFPKGLRIIILDEDPQAAAYAKSKLESFLYVDAKVLYGTDELQWLPDTVSSFSSETDALDALSRESGAFHLALVDASSGNGNGGFRFLEATHDLPTVMMSSKTCLNTMMKSIALGAVEFLQKPVAEDKLKNIWQHVVYKAFTARDVTISDSLKPVRESIISMIQLNSETSSEAQTRRSTSMEEESEVHAKSETQLCISEQQTHSSRTDTNERSSSDKFDAPSTPQQEQQHGNSNSACHREKSPSPRSKRRIEFEVGTCQAAASCNNGEGKQVQQIETEAAAVSDRSSQGNSLQCVKREDQDHDHGEGTSSQVKPTSLLRHQSVDLTCEHLPNAISSSSTSLYAKAEEEVSSAEDPKSNEVCWGKDTTFSPHNCNEENMDSATRDVKEGSRNPNHADKKLNSTSTKKKLKVEWTADLHKRFVQAVEQLGVDQAIPSKILEIMKVDGLTRHNVASHLQKYRAHRRHVSAREDAAARKLWQRYDGSWSYHGIRAAAKALPIGTPVRQPLYVWGCPATIEHGGTSMWQQFPVTNPPVWPPQNGSTWNHSAGIAAEAWGCPSYGMLPHQTNLPKLPLSSNSSMGRGFSTQIEVKSKSSEGHPAAEAIDVAIKEALKNPWSPLPIGLIPPSLESVITELQKQGIDKLPPPVHP